MRSAPALLLVFGACLAGAAPAAGESPIYTYAGTGIASTTGDGGPAASATLNQPAGLEIAADGSLLVAELGGNVIRRITPVGTIQTLAGDGSATHSGDGGPATAAGIFAPRDIALSPDKSVLYVLETQGNTVRRINLAAGTITTVVGTGTPGVTGDFGPAGSALLGAGAQGMGVAANGDLYIADTANNKVRVVAAGANHLIDAGDIITTFAGTGIAGHGGDQSAAVAATLFRPTDVRPMTDGSVIIGDGYQNNNDAQVLRLVTTDGIIRFYSRFGSAASGLTVAGDGGPVSTAPVSSDAEIAFDGAGGLIVVENPRNRVRRVTVTGNTTVVSTLAGSGNICPLTDLCGDYGPAISAPLNAPIGVAGSPTGRLYISEGNRIRVRVYAPGAGGPQGPAGPAGVTGAPGTQGPDGAGGPVGTTGQAGASGAAGAPGAQGPAGARGPDGTNGHPGRTGATGPNGYNGADGGDGAPGELGLGGEPGADGPKGEDGDPFAQIGGMPLVVALPASQILRRRGRVILRIYVSTGTAIAGRAVTDGHAIARTRTFLRAGLKQLDLGRLAPGRYRIIVEARSGSRSSSDRATLFVR